MAEHMVTENDTPRNTENSEREVSYLWKQKPDLWSWNTCHILWRKKVSKDENFWKRWLEYNIFKFEGIYAFEKLINYKENSVV